MRRRPGRAVLTCLIFALAGTGWSCRTLRIPPVRVVMVSVAPLSDDPRACEIKLSDGDDTPELAEIYDDQGEAPQAALAKAGRDDEVFRPRQVLWIVDKPKGTRLTISRSETKKVKSYEGNELSEDIFGKFKLRWLHNAILSGAPKLPARVPAYPVIWYYRLDVEGTCTGSKDPAICVKGGGSGGCTFQQDP